MPKLLSSALGLALLVPVALAQGPPPSLTGTASTRQQAKAPAVADDSVDPGDPAGGIRVTEDYLINVWADQSIFTPLGEAFYLPRAMTFDATNGAYVAARGQIWYLQDRGADCDPLAFPPCQLSVPDGKADPNPILVVDDETSPTGSGSFAGLLFHAGRLYATRAVDNPNDPPNFLSNEVLIFEDRDGDGVVDDIDNDGVLSEGDIVISTDATDWHSIGGLTLTPDQSRILVNKGSYDNDTLGPFGSEPCADVATCNAAILSFDLDGGDLKVWAEGLRNTVEPQFGLDDQLFGVDNGRNAPGLDPPEEVNRIVEGSNLGYPDLTAGQPHPPESQPIAFIASHGGPAGTAVYSYPELLQFPGEREQIFQALYGPISPPIQSLYGQAVVRLNIAKKPNGKYVATPEFAPHPVSGITNAFAWGFDRPVDVAVNHRGDLFIIDLRDDGFAPFDQPGRIYRVIFKDLEIRSSEITVDETFEIGMRGAPFSFYQLYVGIDPDPNFAADIGLGGRNGTTTLNAPVLIKSGTMNASGTKSIFGQVSGPAQDLIGSELRFQMLRIDFDPVTLTFPAADFFIGNAVTRVIQP